jgi:expansin
VTAAHRRAPSPAAVSARWLAAAGLTALAAVLGIAMVMQTGASPACAAVPAPAAAPRAAAPLAAALPAARTVHRGKASFFDPNGAAGNCSFDGPPADGLYVALGSAEYSGAAACGSYLDVTGPKGKVRVKVTDSCASCAAGHIDLSREAFGRIADHAQGVVPVTYRAVVNARVPGPLTVRFKEGASQWWFAVRLDNHANPLRSVEAKTAGGTWRSARRADDNFWIIDAGAGAGPFSIRVRDTNGRRATATGVRLLPAQTQRTSVRLSGPDVRPRPAPSSPAPAEAPSPAAPSASTSASPSAATGAGVHERSGPQVGTPAVGQEPLRLVRGNGCR